MSAFDWSQALSQDSGAPANASAPISSAGAPNASGAPFDWGAAVLKPSGNPGRSNYRAMIKAAQAAPPQVVGSPNLLQRLLIGAGHGMMDVVHGAEQLGLNAINPQNSINILATLSGGKIAANPNVKEGPIQSALASVNKNAAQDNQAYAPLQKAYPISTGIGNIAGNLAFTAPLMFAGGEAAGALLPDVDAGIASNLVRGALKNAAAGAVGGATQYVPPGSGGSHLMNALQGAALNTAIPLAARPLGLGAKKGLGILAKGVSMARPQINPALNAASQSLNIPLTVGEKSGSVPYQKFETVLEHVPFVGMGKARAAQAQAFKTAAQTNLLQPFSGVAEDPQELIRSGAQQVLNENRATAAKMYDEVAQMAQQRRTGVASPLQPGESPHAVAMNATQNAAKDVIDKFSGNQDLNAQPKFVETLRPYTNAAPRSFNDARALRSQLGHMQADAGFGTPEALAYGNLRSAVEKDMDNYALSHGHDLSKAYQEAQDFYRENVVPFKAIAPLKSLVSGRMDPDTIMSSFVKNNRPELASKLMSKLPLESQNAVRLSVLQKGFDKANLGGSREGVAFDPERFATYWENLGTTKDALFDPDSKAMIDGYVKLVRAAPRASSYTEFINKPTGVKTANIGAGLAEGVALATHAHIAVPALGGLIGLRKMLTEPWGQNILLRAAQTKAPSSLMTLAKHAGSQLSSGAAVASRYIWPTVMNQMHQQNTGSPQAQPMTQQ